VTKPLRAQGEASQELNEVVRWYEDRRSGLGSRFLSAVDVTIEQLLRFPQAGAPVPRIPPDLTIRRAPVKGFPYHVVYLETEDALHVLAIAHDKRRPAYWLSRTETDPFRGG
jgi:toxin ParE1/3/4